MADNLGLEPMLDMFIFESIQLIEQLEQLVLDSEKKNGIESHINEIFRIMHTIKGSSAMMLFNNISSLAHAVEDVFFYLRENKPEKVDYSSLIDIVLGSIDFIKAEVSKIKNSGDSNGNASDLISTISSFLSTLMGSGSSVKKSEKDIDVIISEHEYFVSSYKGDCSLKRYKAILHFDDGCEMENVRAFSVVHRLKEFAGNIQHFPRDIIENVDSIEKIRRNGFAIIFETVLDMEKVRLQLDETIFLKELELTILEAYEAESEPKREIILDEPVQDIPEIYFNGDKRNKINSGINQSKQSYLSVNVSKMDKLMDLVGELLISEAMVSQNPDLKDLKLDNFNKSARQLRKISNELQDIVMSIRMVPLSPTFQKMNRIVRDMSKKLKKEVQLEIIGEETEVDKNIIEHISDPLMHLTRNSIDHGIESVETRISAGKPEVGRITLEAKNAGGDVWIIVKDDGKGLDRDKILEKARENGLINKADNELTDRDIYSLILLPGFSTKDNVTEFSGRGVGMDVVTKNIEKMGGTVLIDSKEGEGTAVSIKIPLTLAIIDGMIVKVGNCSYTIPTISIKESFRAKENDIIKDTENNEMIMVRGDCLPVLRLHQVFNIKTPVTDITDGIIVMVENGGRYLCIFADLLLGQLQVVVKALPKYIKKVKGISSCTLLGDGSISLILDISGLTS